MLVHKCDKQLDVHAKIDLYCWDRLTGNYDEGHFDSLDFGSGYETSGRCSPGVSCRAVAENSALGPYGRDNDHVAPTDYYSRRYKKGETHQAHIYSPRNGATEIDPALNFVLKAKTCTWNIIFLTDRQKYMNDNENKGEFELKEDVNVLLHCV